MQAPRLEDVQAQVVAWHNSHPLARRIQASQVHSIGGVLLPFASAQPLPEGLAPQVSAAPPASAAAVPLPQSTPDTAQAIAQAGPAVPQDPEAATAEPSAETSAEPSAETSAETSAEPTTEALDLDIEAIDFDGEGENLDPDDGETDGDELLIDIPDEADQEKTAQAEADEPAPDADATEPQGESTAKPAEATAPEDQTEQAAAAPESASDGGLPEPGASAEDSAREGAETSAQTSTDEVSPFADLDAADAAEAEAAASAAHTSIESESQASSAQVSTHSAASPAETDLDLNEPATQAQTVVTLSAGPAGAEPVAEAAAEPLTPFGERLQAARDKALALDSPADPGAAATPGAEPQLEAASAATATGGSAALPRPAPAQSWWQRWLQRLRPAEPNHPLALPALRSLFSRDFIWPMTIGQVARWSRRHGSVLPVAPDEWPLRVVETDQRLLQGRHTKGFSQPVMLHVMTAAIGVGDRRIRLLLDGKGSIIGPRAYDSKRVGLVGSMGMVLLLVAAGAGLWRAPLPAEEHLASAEAAASQPLPVSPALTEAPAQPEPPAEPDERQAPAPTQLAHAQAAAPAALAEALPDTPAVAADSASAPGPTWLAGLEPPKAPSAASAPVSIAIAAAPAVAAAEPAHDRASAPLGRIRPALSEGQKQQAQLQSRQARHGASQPAQAVSAAVPAGPVYAVVTSPEQRRDLAERSLARIASAQARMPPPAPQQSELMQTDGQWRAVWWPFDNRVDAERARVMLLARGLRAEVLSF